MLLNDDMSLDEAYMAISQGDNTALEALKRLESYLQDGGNPLKNIPIVEGLAKRLDPSLEEKFNTTTPTPDEHLVGRAMVGWLDAVDELEIYGEDVAILFKNIAETKEANFFLLPLVFSELKLNLKEVIDRGSAIDPQTFLLGVAATTAEAAAKNVFKSLGLEF